MYSVAKTAAYILLSLSVIGGILSLGQDANGWNLPYVITYGGLGLCKNWANYALYGFILAVIAGITKPKEEPSGECEAGESSRVARPSSATTTTKTAETPIKPRDITYRTCENCYQSTDESTSNCMFCGVRFSTRNIHAYIPSANGARNRTCPNGHTFAVGDLPFCPDCGCDYSSSSVVDMPTEPPVTDKPVTYTETPPGFLMQMPGEDDL